MPNRTLRQVFDHCPLSDRTMPRTSRLLSCRGAVVGSVRPPPPRLITIGATSCEIVRRTAMPIIAACDRTISGRTSYRLLSWRWREAHWMRGMTACLVQFDRHSGPGSARLLVGTDSTGTRRLTRRACALQRQNLIREGESFDDGEVCDAMSSNSTLISFGMSKLGASPFAVDASTLSANLTSGCSHEP